MDDEDEVKEFKKDRGQEEDDEEEELQVVEKKKKVGFAPEKNEEFEFSKNERMPKFMQKENIDASSNLKKEEARDVDLELHDDMMESIKREKDRKKKLKSSKDPELDKQIQELNIAEIMRKAKE